MPRILLVSGVEKGHLNPFVGVAQWLAALDVEVHWLFLPAPPSQLDGQAMVRHAFPSPLPTHITRGPELVRLVRDPDQLGRWIRRLLVDGVEAQLPGFRTVFADVAPDAILLDPMLYGAAIASEQLGIPWFSVSSSLNPVVPDSWRSLLRSHTDALAHDRASLFARHGLTPRFRLADCLSPHGTFVFATRALVGDVVLPDEVFLVGPSVPPSARGDESGPPPDLPGPLVYCSFGSQISWQPAIYQRVSDVTAALGWSLLISGGELAEDPLYATLAGRTSVVSYAPQRCVLESAAVFISHCGANSVMEAATAGVPILAMPVCNDQHNNARFVQASGLGQRLDLDIATNAEITDALQVLAQRRAEGIRSDYQQHDGAQAVARTVLQRL